MQSPGGRVSVCAAARAPAVAISSWLQAAHAFENQLQPSGSGAKFYRTRAVLSSTSARALSANANANANAEINAVLKILDVEKYAPSSSSSLSLANNRARLVAEGTLYESVFTHMWSHAWTPHVLLSYAFEAAAMSLGNSDISPRPALVLEDMRAQTLLVWLETDEAASITNWRIVLFQIMYTLECFFAAGFVHGDLLPKNIFVERLAAPRTVEYRWTSSLGAHVARQHTRLQVRIFDLDRSFKVATPLLPYSVRNAGIGATAQLEYFHENTNDINVDAATDPMKNLLVDWDTLRNKLYQNLARVPALEREKIRAILRTEDVASTLASPFFGTCDLMRDDDAPPTVLLAPSDVYSAPHWPPEDWRQHFYSNVAIGCECCTERARWRAANRYFCSPACYTAAFSHQ